MNITDKEVLTIIAALDHSAHTWHRHAAASKDADLPYKGLTAIAEGRTALARDLQARRTSSAHPPVLSRA